MKIAFTGSSSTGKTTLAKHLIATAYGKGRIPPFVTEDARSLLRHMGHTSMDKMSPEECREFQVSYLQQKKTREQNLDHYLVDRSFVDVAAYWLVRDSEGLDASSIARYVDECQELALRYDIHLYFPFGQIPFAFDGYRSEDITFHKDIDAAIVDLMREWHIKPVVIESSAIEARAKQVLRTIDAHLAHGSTAER